MWAQSRAVATTEFYFSSLSVECKLTGSTYSNIIESYPVVCILSPEATEDFHHGVGAGIECYCELLVAGRGAVACLRDNVDTPAIASLLPACEKPALKSIP
jgi:hypothetical protein